jgi:hypothetical protein
MCRCTDHPMDAAGSAHSAEVDARWESERAQFDAVGVHVVHEARQGLVKPCAPSRRACRRSLFPSAVAHASPPRTGWYQGGLGGQRRVSRKRGGGRAGSRSGRSCPKAVAAGLEGVTRALFPASGNLARAATRSFPTKRPPSGPSARPWFPRGSRHPLRPRAPGKTRVDALERSEVSM